MSQEYAALIITIDSALLIAMSVQLHAYRREFKPTQNVRAMRVAWLAPFPVAVLSIGETLWWAGGTGQDPDPDKALRLFLGVLILLALVIFDAVAARFLYEEAERQAPKKRPRR